MKREERETVSQNKRFSVEKKRGLDRHVKKYKTQLNSDFFSHKGFLTIRGRGYIIDF